MRDNQYSMCMGRYKTTSTYEQTAQTKDTGMSDNMDSMGNIAARDGMTDHFVSTVNIPVDTAIPTNIMLKQ
ncbi:MAG: hypothetical protein Q4A74_04545 [Cardiobacteriaceae bacterium]|nr:hypothetical protein [Cardiobacteriaceae bacterium]